MPLETCPITDKIPLRTGITSLAELMPYSAHMMNQNLPKSCKLILLQWKVQWQDKIDNMHSSPINGTKNWGGHIKNAPRNYPGWYGRVWVFFSKNPHIRLSNEWTNTFYEYNR